MFLQVERDKKLLQKKLADADAAKKGAQPKGVDMGLLIRVV
jgi:hypothetical protein